MNTTTLKGRKVLYVNRANVNDRVYVRENFKPLPETVPLTLDAAPGNNAGFASNFRFMGNYLYCDVTIDLDTIYGRILASKTGQAFITTGTGKLVSQGPFYVVNDYSIAGVVALDHDKSAFSDDSPLDDLIYAVQFALDRVARRVKSFIGIE